MSELGLSYLMLFSNSNLIFKHEYTEFISKEGSIGNNVSSAFCSMFSTCCKGDSLGALVAHLLFKQHFLF